MLFRSLLEVKTHIHTYWGEGATGICKEYGTEYYHGYNPQNNQWKSMANEDKINMQGKEYFVFGGSGINATFQTDSKGNKPIPYEIAGEYRHGISGIAMRLKQECDYTVIYQIHEQEVGWMEPKSDGEEAMKEKDKPFSSIRVALVRKEEKQKILEEWKKDIGKHV